MSVRVICDEGGASSSKVRCPGRKMSSTSLLVYSLTDCQLDQLTNAIPDASGQIWNLQHVVFSFALPGDTQRCAMWFGCSATVWQTRSSERQRGGYSGRLRGFPCGEVLQRH
eukprot:6492287-Amphidinium_carterae.2